MVHMEPRVATVSFFSTSKNAAFIGHKKLPYTKLSLQLHLCSLSDLKTHALTLSNVLACQ